MKFKDCFPSSEDLEGKTLRSFSLITSVFFSEDQSIIISGKAWLHSHGRNASNACSQMELLKDKTNLLYKEALGWNSRNLFRSIPGTSDNDTMHSGATEIT